MQWLKSSNYIQSFIIKNKESGFSLIELSIVLIIIGLLVAGITGGQSLIESAKARAVMNEARGYMQAVNTYFAAKGRLPGDPENTGKMGINSGIDIDEDDYDEDIYEPTAPWFDLNRDGITDYDIDTEITTLGKESKYIKNALYKFIAVDNEYWINDPDIDNSYISDFENKNIMSLTSMYNGYIPSKTATNIEEKMDDKSLDTGSIRVGFCSESIPDVEENFRPESSYGDITTYNDLVDAKNGGCDEITFKLDL